MVDGELVWRRKCKEHGEVVPHWPSDNDPICPGGSEEVLDPARVITTWASMADETLYACVTVQDIIEALGAE